MFPLIIQKYQKITAFTRFRSGLNPQLAWLNDYHTKCLEVVGPALKERGKTEAYQWLKEQTQLIG